MLECFGRLEPDPLFGVFVGEEEPILLGVPKSFDLGQPGPNLGAGIQHSRLKKVGFNFGLQKAFSCDVRDEMNSPNK